MVTDLDGGRISFGRASVRFFGMLISTFILLIGFLMVLFTRRKQALHDIIAGCLRRLPGTRNLQLAVNLPTFERSNLPTGCWPT